METLETLETSPAPAASSGASAPPAPLISASVFRLGGPVQTSEGEPATLAQVVMDVSGQSVTHIGVRFSSGLFGHGQVSYAPFEVITEATPDMVTLAVSRQELDERMKATPTGFKLSVETQVLLDGKRVGRVSQLIFENTTQVLWRLVIDRGLSGEWSAPASAVTQLDARQIALSSKGTKKGTNTTELLTPYVPDAELIEDVRRAIEDYPRLRIDLKGINIHAIAGVVWLDGHVSSDLNRLLAAEQLQGMHGLAELHNDLIADNQLAINVSKALASDPRTAHAHIGVYPSLGVVHLRGVVATDEIRQAAEHIARAVPGVKAVFNETRINPTSDVLPILAGVTGDEDLVPGGE
jgi:osmotically-inducible protein OsmY